MPRQYGSPPSDPRKEKGNAYTERRDSEPKPKEEDPSPPTDLVEQFHRNARVDTRNEDIHHTIGANGASGYAHSHDGADSVLLLEGVTITGSKAGNAALASVINALVRLGAKDSTT